MPVAASSQVDKLKGTKKTLKGAKKANRHNGMKPKTSQNETA